MEELTGLNQCSDTVATTQTLLHLKKNTVVGTSDPITVLRTRHVGGTQESLF